LKKRQARDKREAKGDLERERKKAQDSKEIKRFKLALEDKRYKG